MRENFTATGAREDGGRVGVVAYTHKAAAGLAGRVFSAVAMVTAANGTFRMVTCVGNAGAMLTRKHLVFFAKSTAIGTVNVSAIIVVTLAN